MDGTGQGCKVAACDRERELEGRPGQLISRVMRRKGTARRGAVYMEAAMRVVVRSTSRLVGERGHVAGAREGAASGAAGPPAEDGTERSRFWTHQLVHPCVTPVVRTFHPCVTPVVRSGKDAMQCNGGRGRAAREVYTFATPTPAGGGLAAWVGEGRPHETVAA